MKTYLSILCFLVYTVSGNDALTAYTCYVQGEYAQALQLYQALPAHNAASWFTQGNCAYMVGNYPHAISCWYKAQRSAGPYLVYCCAYNTDVVLEKLGHSTPSTRAAIARCLVAMVRIIPVLWWQLILLALVYFFVFIAYKSGKKKWKMLLCLALLCMPVAGIVYYLYQQESARVLILHTQAPLYAGAQEYHAQRAQLEAACILPVYVRQNEWCKVKYAGIYGWVQMDKGTIVG